MELKYTAADFIRLNQENLEARARQCDNEWFSVINDALSEAFSNAQNHQCNVKTIVIKYENAPCHDVSDHVRTVLAQQGFRISYAPASSNWFITLVEPK